jgi:hypothetical protein
MGKEAVPATPGLFRPQNKGENEPDYLFDATDRLTI